MNISLEDLSLAIAAVHEAAADPQQWPRALDAVMRVMQVDKAGMFDVARNGQVSVTARGYDPEVTAAYMRHYMPIDPNLAVLINAPPHEVCTSYENFTLSERNRSEYFDFARSVDIGDVSAIKTHRVAGHQTMLTLQRAHGARVFNADSKQLLALFAPHLEIAKRVQIRLAEASAQLATLSAGLDQFAFPALIVDTAAKIRHLNAAATSLLSANRAIRSASDKLVLSDQRLNAQLACALKRAIVEPRRAAALMWRLRDEPAEIVVSPLLPNAAMVSSWQEPLALVMIAIARHDAKWIAARMQQLYGLTDAEARVTAQIALGDTIESLAAKNGVQPSTLRSQLKSIFGKTSVSRQSDLVRLALNGVPLNEQSSTTCTA